MKHVSRMMATAAAVALLAGSAAQAEVVLRAVTGVPGPTPVAQVFLQYVERVNEAGAGVVQIDYLGGPEAMPPSRQGVSLQRGLIDMLHAPGAFYAGNVREADALLGTNLTMEEIRANGALDLLDQLWQEQLNAKIVGWFDTSVRFHLYLSEAPVVTEDRLDLNGMRLFATQTYRDLQEALNGVPVAMEVGEIMTALDSGVIQGYGFPNYGIVAFGFGRKTAYRIDPSYYSGNVPALVNLDVWNGLPQEARDILTQVAIEWEADSPEYIAGFRDRELAQLQEEGMEILELPEAAAEHYLALAYDILWDRVIANSPEHGPVLRDLLFDPDR